MSLPTMNGWTTLHNDTDIRYDRPIWGCGILDRRLFIPQ